MIMYKTYIVDDKNVAKTHCHLLFCDIACSLGGPGHTCLQLAVMEGRLHMIGYLLKAGVTVDALDKDGHTALYYAVGRFTILYLVQKLVSQTCPAFALMYVLL